MLISTPAPNHLFTPTKAQVCFFMYAIMTGLRKPCKRLGGIVCPKDRRY